MSCVIMYNFGDKVQSINKHQAVAQLVFERVTSPEIEIVKDFTQTQRKKSHNKIDTTRRTLITKAIAKLDCNMQLQLDTSYNIDLSNNLYDHHQTTRVLPTKGKHPKL